MSDVIMDCTELYHNPVRTGIQRVLRELIRRWPKSGPRLHVARFSAGSGLLRLPQEAIEVLTDALPGVGQMSREDIIQRLDSIPSGSDPRGLPPDATLFIPELFYDPVRCDYYQNLVERRKLAFLIYDFLPFTHPDLFTFRSAAPLMNYVRLVRSARNVAHISKVTRNDYYRVSRTPGSKDSPVITLGADGWSMAPQSWTPARHTFVMIGSLEKRKNQHVAVDAFRRLWARGVNAKLVLIGRIIDRSEQGLWNDTPNEPWLRHMESATDEEIVRELSSARCTLFLSEAEGFGLPPIESLAVGIPVIAHSSVPSIHGLPEHGQIRLSNVTADTVEGAVLKVLDDDYAEALWARAKDLELATWDDFAQRVSTWIAGIAR